MKKRKTFILKKYTIVLVVFMFLIFSFAAHAQDIIIFNTPKDKSATIRVTVFYAIQEEIRKGNVKVVKSLSQHLSKENIAIYKNAESTGKVEKRGGHLNSVMEADVVKEALVVNLLSSSAGSGYSVAGLPELETYVEVKGTKKKPLYVAKNLCIWKGVIYSDGKGNIYLADGTSYEFIDKAKFTH